MARALGALFAVVAAFGAVAVSVSVVAAIYGVFIWVLCLLLSKVGVLTAALSFKKAFVWGLIVILANRIYKGLTT
jgi:hypothetical protein